MKKCGTEFKKPYGKELFGCEPVTHYAYPREELIANEIFPYLVFDGGAAQLLLDRFGSIKGDRLLELTMSGELFREFQSGGEFSWERSFAYTEGTDFTKKYEWQIWPQRLYMTIPVAHAFLRTGDKKYADEWLRIVKGWDAAHPYQPFDPEIHYITTDMVWRDMQVAWRTQSLLHGIFMLSDAPYSHEDWKYLYDFLELHVNHMYKEALDRLRRNHAQNHVLQIGVVLIMAAVMFPEFKNSCEILKIGIDTVRMNLRAIFADGGSNEDSPSYSHFIVRLYLEAYLLLKNNSKEIPEGLLESINRQYSWIYQCAAPNGKNLRLSDSYSLDSMADIERARRLIPLNFSTDRKSTLFDESAVGILRIGKMSLYVDAMEFIPHGHQHAGRPQILLYRGERPVIIDAGCCSYDRWELYFKLRSAEMHNVVFCDGLDEDRMQIGARITEFDPECGIIAFESNVISGDISYRWERRLTLSEDSLTIEDRAKSEKALRFHSRLFLLRNDTKVQNKHTVCQLCDEYIMTLTSNIPISTELRPVMNDSNRIDYSIAVESESEGSSFSQKTVISFENR